MRKYFSERERYQLELLLQQKVPVKEICKILNRCKTTIYREIKNGTVEMLSPELIPYKKYCADRGQQVQEERSHNKGKDLKIGNDLALIKFMESMILEKKYSPAAILAHIKKNNLQFKTKLCFKTVYNYVEKGILLNVKKQHLPMPRKKLEASARKKRQAWNHNHTSIELRPQEIYERMTYGHWELDTVESGKGDKTCLFVFTERCTREELIFKADGKNQKCLLKILDTLERKLTAPVFRDTFKTITCDNGVEFLDMEGMEKSRYNKIMKRTKVYYCHPYNACERGSNENANKLIRRWIPKGAHISEFTDQYIKEMQDWINDYPRKIFNWLSSAEYKKLYLSK